jgi:hypothetical protein
MMIYLMVDPPLKPN